MDMLGRIVSRLKPAGANLSWVPEENWHVTLQFLGEASVAQAECIAQALREVRAAEIRIELGKLERLGRDGALVLEVPPTEALASLQTKVLAASVRCGFAAEARPYRPHLTLARSRRGASAKLSLARAELQPAAATIRKFILYESHLGPGGARYLARARFPLR